MTRTEFREGVFARDGDRCVICGATAQTDHLDAHHLLERRLFCGPHELGGYFLLNGVSLCTPHHIQAEETTLTCEAIRQAAAITRVVLPSHLYDDVSYDKWGNQIEPNGTRLRGELFYDESVQRILAQGGVLGEFLPYTRYQRTYHLPWSNMTRDDRILENVSAFEGREVVVTEKMDGANITIYRDYIHGRSVKPLAGGDENGRLKTMHATMAHNIPEGWRLCGEHVLPKHSIRYSALPAIFELFSVWDERNECLSWDETQEWAALLDMEMVPALYRGPWDEKLVRGLFTPVKADGDEMEGYVVRLARRFSYGEFRRCMAKFVRPNFAAGRHTFGRVLEFNDLAS